MNTINEEDLKFLIDTGKEMNKQNNRCTQFPVFVVMHKVKVYGDSSYCSEVERKNREDYNAEEVLCDKCQKLFDKDKKLPDYCEECGSDGFSWFNWEDKIEDGCGVFLTAKAAQRHIDENYYHYYKPFTYGISCWRNPEMQKVLEILSKLGGNGEALSHYK